MRRFEVDVAHTGAGKGGARQIAPLKVRFDQETASETEATPRLQPEMHPVEIKIMMVLAAFAFSTTWTSRTQSAFCELPCNSWRPWQRALWMFSDELPDEPHDFGRDQLDRGNHKQDQGG